jgi:enolase
VWLNSSTRTIHMSQHMTKERRHKEASLADVTSVVSGPPAKSKGNTGNEILGDLCLTVNFKRGGGIDLQFKSREERDSWYNTLLKIVAEFDRNKI